MNRLAHETSPYLLQHAANPVAEASSYDADHMEVVPALPVRPFGLDA